MLTSYERKILKELNNTDNYVDQKFIENLIDKYRNKFDVNKIIGNLNKDGYIKAHKVNCSYTDKYTFVQNGDSYIYYNISLQPTGKYWDIDFRKWIIEKIIFSILIPIGVAFITALITALVAILFKLK